MIAMALPTVLLYELAIVAVRYVERANERERIAAQGG
jgi:Sec-independent protein secretion pathway component TatC